MDLKNNSSKKGVFFDIKLPKVTFSTTKSYILRFGREKCDIVFLEYKSLFWIIDKEKLMNKSKFIRKICDSFDGHNDSSNVYDCSMENATESKKIVAI